MSPQPVHNVGCNGLVGAPPWVALNESRHNAGDLLRSTVCNDAFEKMTQNGLPQGPRKGFILQGAKTLIDLDSVDEYYASLPRVETRAS